MRTPISEWKKEADEMGSLPAGKVGENEGLAIGHLEEGGRAALTLCRIGFR